MKEFKGYKCDHCGKLYQLKHACEKHENISCRKHPNNEHLCWWCPLLTDQQVDHFRGEHYDGSEIIVKTTAFFCKKKNVNLYSFGFDKYIDIFEPAQVDENKSTERMPSKSSGCDQYEGIN